VKTSPFLITALILGCTLAAPADEVSGPHRMTLSDESWGTIFYVPQELKDYKYTRSVDSGKRRMITPKGDFEFAEIGIGGHTIQGPKGHLISVEGNSSNAKVTLDGQLYEFIHDGEKFHVKLPKNPIEYRFEAHDIVIEGNFGKTVIHEQGGNYVVTSPKGKYSYTPSSDGGFEVKGGPLATHPGMYRGAIFDLGGVGVFVDFKKLDTKSPLFRFLEFSPMLEVRPGK
jgi:hypothetical protein